MAVKFELPFTQTSTVVAFSCTLLLAVVLTFKMDVEGKSLMTSLVKLCHLGAFSTWTGVQVWVTFFAGITMYRHLPRHTFGYIQGRLFPKYFALGAVLSSLTLATFLVHNPFSSWEMQHHIQGWCLIGGVLTALCNLVYLEPQTTKCTMQKHKFEKEVNAGQEVGKVADDKLEELR